MICGCKDAGELVKVIVGACESSLSATSISFNEKKRHLLKVRKGMEILEARGEEKNCEIDWESRRVNGLWKLIQLLGSN